MDNLSSLSNGLPRRASTQQELEDLDTSLVGEFKTAASAVTKLFKLAGAKTSLAREQGYIDALQDLLTCFDEDPALDAQSWALARLVSLCPDEGPSRHSPSPRETTVLAHATAHVDGSHDVEPVATLQSNPPNATTGVHPEVAAKAVESQPPAPPSGMFTFRSDLELPQNLPSSPEDRFPDMELFGEPVVLGDKRRTGLARAVDADLAKRLKRGE